MKKYFTKKRMAALTMCVLSSIAGIGYAAEADLNTYEGEEYVVTATKTKLEAKEVPIAVEVVTQEQIQDMGAINVRDALKMAQGLELSKSGMTGNNVMIRGMDQMHSLILIDGKRPATEDAPETFNVYTLNRINMSDVERIEIIRGSGSVLYGSDAMGGVINIITKKAAKKNFSVGFDTGTEEVNKYFSYASGKEGKLSFKANGRWTKERLNPFNGTQNQHGDKKYFDVGINYDLGNNKGLDLDINYGKEDLRTNNKSSTGSDVATKYDNETYGAGLTYYGKDDKHDYNVRAYYTQLQKYQDGSTTTKRGFNYVSKDDEHKFTTFVVEGKDSIKIDKVNTLTWGAEYKHQKSERDYGLGSPMLSSISHTLDEHSINSYAVYVQDEMKLNDKFLLIPAVRYDYQNDFGSNFVGKLSSTYFLHDNSRIKFNFGQGYRTPTLFELYGNMQNGMPGAYIVDLVGNEDLDPEKSVNIDISYEVEQGKSNAKISYFHNDVKNLIDTVERDVASPIKGYGYYTYENIDKAEIQGLEFSAGYELDKHWSVKTTYTYLDAKNKNTDERLNYRARQSGNVSLSYTDATENPLTATLWGDYKVAYRYSSENYTFGTLNFMINKHFSKNMRVYAALDNILDKSYEDAGLYLLDGRTWRVGAEWTF